jgi:YVTN family beta-propeller protein
MAVPSGSPRTSAGLRYLALAMVACASALLFAPSALAGDAYVVNDEGKSVSVIDTSDNQVTGSPIMVGKEPVDIAITPDGRFAYVTDYGSNSVSVIDTRTNQVVGSPIKVGTHPRGIAITPDGREAYVANLESGTVSAIDTQKNEVVGPPIAVGTDPEAIAVSPDGRFAYVVTFGFPGAVVTINTQTNQVVGSPIPDGEGASGIAITPDGRSAYVADEDAESVSAIDTQTNQVVPIEVGKIPVGVAITPSGGTAYVSDYNGAAVSVIDTQTDQTAPAIHTGGRPDRIAITPDGKTAYVTNFEGGAVRTIDTQTNKLIGSAINVGAGPIGVAIVPDQSPSASFAVPARARPGVPLAFNASASSDPDGSIASYAWSFGEGQSGSGGPTTTHTYSAPGTYQASLTLTDNEGCSTSFVFTGQTAYCNGSPSAGQTQTVTVAYPGVRLKCPKSAKPKGCEFKLRVLSKKRKGKAESAVAKAKAKAGRSALVSLKPKKAFAKKLAAAKKVLVKETLKAHGSKRTLFKRLKIVQ